MSATSHTPNELNYESDPADDVAASPVTRDAIRVHLMLGRMSAGLVIAVAVLVLVGWTFDVELLKSLMHPARIPMNPLGAVCFILAAVAVELVVRVPVTPRRRAAVDLLAGVVLVVGLIQLAAAAGSGFRLDRTLFAGRLGDNFMAPNAAASFALVGMALLLVDRRAGRSRPAPWLALGCLAVALLALLGYAYDISPLYQFRGNYTAMALNSAICFYVLALGVLAARPDHPPLSTLLSDSVGGLISRRLLPAAILVPALVGFVALAVVRQGGAGPELAVLLFTLTTILVFVALTGWTADRLHRLDMANRETVQRLKRAEAVYHSLVENVPQNIFRKDLLGRFTFANHHFCATVDRPLDQVVGKTDFDFYGPELAARYRHDDLDVARRGTPMDVVEEHVTPAGDRLYVQVIKTPVRGADGQVIGVQGIFWDVTDRVVAQRSLEEKNKALEEANERLQQAVAAERAAIEQLTKTQTHLVQSEKMVGLGQMVAGVAHEINNPLAFVSNNVAVLQRDFRAIGRLIDLYRGADADLQTSRPELLAEISELAEAIDLDYTRTNLGELLDRSREGLRRIQQIVRDLRDFVRLDESDLQEVDLNAGVDSTLNIIAGHAKKKQITIEKDLAPLPPLTCYPAKVNQVIMNLVGNAIDASAENGCVTIRTRPAVGLLPANDGASPDGVLLEVSDHGCGISQELRGRIFDPFFTTKPVGQGTGLGLSISYGIVRDHGGAIEVDSEPGQGSTFRITFPLRGPAKQEEQRIERQAAVGSRQ